MDTSALDGILLRLPSLDEDAVRMLHAGWAGGDVVVRMRAWKHGKRILAQRHAERAYRDASDQVSRWLRDYATGRAAVPDGLDGSAIDVGRLDHRIAAAPAVLDALLGALVGHELDEDEREELMAPWWLATEPPPGPAD
jgi:hypothetical protein